MADEKYPKRAVNYRKGTRDHKCGLCTMFRHGTVGDWCTAVQGAIDAEDTCDIFEKK
jgi:hypothetical protein